MKKTWASSNLLTLLFLLVAIISEAQLSDVLVTGMSLAPWEYLVSEDGNYKLRMDGDICQLVFYHQQDAIWMSSIIRKIDPREINNCKLVLSKYGNLAVMGDPYESPIWETRTGLLIPRTCELKVQSYKNIFKQGGIASLKCCASTAFSSLELTVWSTET